MLLTTRLCVRVNPQHHQRRRLNQRQCFNVIVVVFVIIVVFVVIIIIIAKIIDIVVFIVVIIVAPFSSSIPIVVLVVVVSFAVVAILFRHHNDRRHHHIHTKVFSVSYFKRNIPSINRVEIASPILCRCSVKPAPMLSSFDIPVQPQSYLRNRNIIEKSIHQLRHQRRKNSVVSN